MQLAHFSFGIGAFFSPFIVEPFLREIADEGIGHSSASTTNSTDSDVTQVPLSVDPSTLRIKWAFFIIGGFSLLVWVTFVMTFLKKRGNKPHPTRESAKVKQPNDKNETKLTIAIVNLDENSNSVNEKPTDEKPTNEKSNEKEAWPVNRNYRPYHKFMIVILSALFIHLAYGLELSFGVMLASYARLSNLQMTKSSASFITS